MIEQRSFLSQSQPGPFVTRSTLGWQTMLADLSLILFMVSAAAMGDAQPSAPTPPPRAAPAPTPKPDSTPARAEPLAIWRDAPGMPDLGVWLASQQPDARQQLTITLRYAPRDLAKAMDRGAALAHVASAHVADAGGTRIILQPTAGLAQVEAVAALAYDREAAR